MLQEMRALRSNTFGKFCNCLPGLQRSIYSSILKAQRSLVVKKHINLCTAQTYLSLEPFWCQTPTNPLNTSEEMPAISTLIFNHARLTSTSGPFHLLFPPQQPGTLFPSIFTGLTPHLLQAFFSNITFLVAPSPTTLFQSTPFNSPCPASWLKFSPKRYTFYLLCFLFVSPTSM